MDYPRAGIFPAQHRQSGQFPPENNPSERLRNVDIYMAMPNLDARGINIPQDDWTAIVSRLVQLVSPCTVYPGGMVKCHRAIQGSGIAI